MEPAAAAPSNNFVADEVVWKLQSGATLTVAVPPATNVDLQAHRIWNSARALAQLIEAGTVPVEGLRVVELGAGAGIPGLVAASTGARHVVLTDYPDPRIIAALRHTVEANGLAHVEAAGHAFGEDLTSPLEDGAADLILCADCIWLDQMHAPLATSMQRLLAPDGVAMVAYVHHFTSQNGTAQTQRFFKTCEAAGLVVTSPQPLEVQYEAEPEIDDEPEPCALFSKPTTVFIYELRLAACGKC